MSKKHKLVKLLRGGTGDYFVEAKNFKPIFEAVLTKRNFIGEPKLNTKRTKCKKCGVIHKYDVVHLTAASGHKLRGQYEWFRKKNPTRNIRKKKDVEN